MQKIHNDDLVLKVKNQKDFTNNYLTTYRHGKCLIVEYGVDMNSVFNSDLDDILTKQDHGEYDCILVKFEETPAGDGHKWYYINKIEFEEKNEGEEEYIEFRSNVNTEESTTKSSNPFKKNNALETLLIVSSGVGTMALGYLLYKTNKKFKCKTPPKSNNNKPKKDYAKAINNVIDFGLQGVAAFTKIMAEYGELKRKYSKDTLDKELNKSFDEMLNEQLQKNKKSAEKKDTDNK